MSHVVKIPLLLRPVVGLIFGVIGLVMVAMALVVLAVVLIVALMALGLAVVMLITLPFTALFLPTVKITQKSKASNVVSF